MAAGDTSAAGDISAWRDVDATPNFASLLRFLDEVAAQPAIAAAKRRSFELLRLAAGARVLDVGCGTGADVLALARAVAPGGQAVGVDRSARAIAAARRRTGASATVSFAQADAAALPFADATFDAARADRVLLHVLDPRRVLAELVRVTRAGGRVVVTELSVSGSQPRSVGAATGRLEQWQVTPFVPLLLSRAGAEEIAIERSEHTLRLTKRMRDVLHTECRRLRLKVVHVVGEVARPRIFDPAG